MATPLMPPPPANDTTGAASAGAGEKILRVLGQIAQARRPQSLADLVLALQMPKASLHRLCTQLLALRYLSRDFAGRGFVVGPAMRRLVFDALHNDYETGLRHQVLQALVRDVGETCNLTTIDGLQVLYVDRIEAKWPLRLTLEVGTHVPLHCTASGKLLLALKPEAERERLLSCLRCEPMTPHTHRYVDELRAECTDIARQGFACDREEFILGLIAVAVPVFNSQELPVAAIAMHAPVARMSVDRAMAFLPRLKEAAAAMSSIL